MPSSKQQVCLAPRISGLEDERCRFETNRIILRPGLHLGQSGFAGPAARQLFAVDLADFHIGGVWGEILTRRRRKHDAGEDKLDQ